MDKRYSTAEIAREVGISKRTLLRWIYAGEVPEPAERIRIAGSESRLWTQDELDYVKAYKEQYYRKRS